MFIINHINTKQYVYIYIYIYIYILKYGKRWLVELISQHNETADWHYPRKAMA